MYSHQVALQELQTVVVKVAGSHGLRWQDYVQQLCVSELHDKRDAGFRFALDDEAAMCLPYWSCWTIEFELLDTRLVRNSSPVKSPSSQVKSSHARVSQVNTLSSPSL